MRVLWSLQGRALITFSVVHAGREIFAARSLAGSYSVELQQTRVQTGILDGIDGSLGCCVYAT